VFGKELGFLRKVITVPDLFTWIQLKQTIDLGFGVINTI
jgi:hypothetical protein